MCVWLCECVFLWFWRQDLKGYSVEALISSAMPSFLPLLILHPDYLLNAGSWQLRRSKSFKEASPAKAQMRCEGKMVSGLGRK